MNLSSLDDDELMGAEFHASLLARRGSLVGRPEFINIVLTAALSEDEGDIVAEMIDRRNPSCKQPYHGFIHTAAVVVAAYEGAYYHELSTEDRRDLVVAAAMHDFDHYGQRERESKIADVENIKHALCGIDLLASYVRFNVDKVKRLVKSTEYPYSREPDCLLEAILRDADLTMPLLEDKHALELYHGLYLEMLANKAEMTYEQFISSTPAFFQKNKATSAWGSSYRADGRLEGRVNRIVTLLQENPI